MELGKVRQWQGRLATEYPMGQSPWVWSYRRGPYRLYFVAAMHSTNPASETHRLINRLFRSAEVDAVLIEGLPFSAGPSPAEVLAKARQEITLPRIPGGEAALGAVRAAEREIPFYGGEPDPIEVYRHLRSLSFSDEDIVGFYLIRAIPRWMQEEEFPDHVIEKKAAAFLTAQCGSFGIDASHCPTYRTLIRWFAKRMHRRLDSTVTVEDTAPLHESPELTHRIASQEGDFRDHFTAGIIEQLARRHSRLVVIYGARHAITLRQALEDGFGKPATLDVNWEY